ncbi:MAG: hemin uptake protein HemP [Devosia sp.]
MTPPPDAETRDLPPEAAASAPRVFTSAELFGGDDEITVLHNGAAYRLRVTRQNKLILTK